MISGSMMVSSMTNEVKMTASKVLGSFGSSKRFSYKSCQNEI